MIALHSWVGLHPLYTANNKGFGERLHGRFDQTPPELCPTFETQSRKPVKREPHGEHTVHPTKGFGHRSLDYEKKAFKRPIKNKGFPEVGFNYQP